MKSTYKKLKELKEVYTGRKSKVPEHVLASGAETATPVRRTKLNIPNAICIRVQNVYVYDARIYMN